MREKEPLDLGLLLVIVALVVCGILFIYDSSFVRAGQAKFTGYDPQFFLKRQLISVAVGSVLMLTVMHVPFWKLGRLAVAGMPLAIILLVLVLLFGQEANGARRALGSGLLRFQPAEFAKLAVVLFLARWLSRSRHRVRRFQEGFLPLTILLLMVGLLIEREPDLGTALVVVGTGFVMLFLGGAKKRHLLGLVLVCALAAALLVAMKPYRLGRIASWRDPFGDPQNRGYQVVHSLIAIGSGSFFGVGLGQGRQKYFYLPAEHTDYIFGTIGEELGLVGTWGMLFLFLFLVARGFNVAHRCGDPFGALVAGGISSMVALQTLLNIGVATNVLPCTGVPLPFISYGGSSLVLTMLSMGILLNISQYPAAVGETSKSRDEGSLDRRRNRWAYQSGYRYR
ncbi:MAG: putative lipid II flippase FtsW [Armatimonadota bacterium]|nr:putative lipid II flippase FtsW [Armatimonadota bacterium]